MLTILNFCVRGLVATSTAVDCGLYNTQKLSTILKCVYTVKEHQIQCGVFAWLRIRRIKAFSVPNAWPIRGMRQSAKYALRSYLKAEGLERGVPDFFVPGSPPWLPNCPGMAIEMKTSTGQLSVVQIEWLLHFAALGWFAKVCYSEHEAIQTMIRVGY